MLTFTHYFCLILIMILTAVPGCHRCTPPNYPAQSIQMPPTCRSGPPIGQLSAHERACRGYGIVDLSKTDITIPTLPTGGIHFAKNSSFLQQAAGSYCTPSNNVRPEEALQILLCGFFPLWLCQFVPSLKEWVRGVGAGDKPTSFSSLKKGHSSKCGRSFGTIFNSFFSANLDKKSWIG